MPRRIRCVTFDCYGTLIDWERGIGGSLLSLPALEENRDLVKRLVALREEIEKGLIVSAPNLPDEESPAERFEAPPYRPYREILAESIALAARELGVALGPGDPAAVAETMPAWDPFPDTREALSRIKSRFPIAILSNVEDEVIAATLRRIGVPFDFVVTAQKVGAYKPSPDHWYAAMHELEADEEEIFHLGASPFHDLETASLLGIPCGYVNRSGHPLTAESHPVFVVPDLDGAAKKLAAFPPARGRPASGGEAARRPGQAPSPSRSGLPGQAGRPPRSGPRGSRRR